ncbi:hypothetical protein BC628DRAFT_1376013 [Trametes gibbosa]|nr:hypothetical protein BC628DRAFT_1376013 [Trametes gibbosa]
MSPTAPLSAQSSALARLRPPVLALRSGGHGCPSTTRNECAHLSYIIYHTSYMYMPSRLIVGPATSSAQCSGACSRSCPSRHVLPRAKRQLIALSGSHDDGHAPTRDGERHHAPRARARTNPHLSTPRPGAAGERPRLPGRRTRPPSDDRSAQLSRPPAAVCTRPAGRADPRRASVYALARRDSRTQWALGRESIQSAARLGLGNAGTEQVRALCRRATTPLGAVGGLTKTGCASDRLALLTRHHACAPRARFSLVPFWRRHLCAHRTHIAHRTSHIPHRWHLWTLSLKPWTQPTDASK